MKPFEERTRLEHGFADVHQRQIKPLLASLEADRLRLRARTRRDLRAILIIAAGLAIVTLVLAGDGSRGLALLPLIGGAAGAVLLARRRQAAWEQKVIGIAVPAFCEALGLRYQAECVPGPYLAPFEQAGLIQPSERRSLTHHFSGVHRGTAFDFVHASLRRRGRGERSVFHGLLFRIHVPITSPASIVITPNPGPLSPLLETLSPSSGQEAMQPLSLGDPAFEERFVLRAGVIGAEEERTVRAFASARFRAGLLAINEAEGKLAHGRGALAAAFIGDMFYLALSRYDTRMVGSIPVETPRPFLKTASFLRLEVDLEATIRDMFDDVSVAYRIIDLLHDGK